MGGWQGAARYSGGKRKDAGINRRRTLSKLIAARQCAAFVTLQSRKLTTTKGITMSLRISTIRPGVLVSLKTTLTGNVRYFTTDIEREHLLDNGQTSEAEWNTRRITLDKEEHELAVKTRSKCRSLVTGVCTAGNFLMCRQDRRDELEKAIAEAEALARSFNTTATVTRLGFYVGLTEVAPDDARWIAMVNSEVRDLLDAMAQGVKNLDADAIRKAANTAQSVGKTLTPEAQEKLQSSIDAVRKQARAFVKAGETAASTIDAAVMQTLTESRTAFLELEPVAEVAAPEAEGRGVDFTPVSSATELYDYRSPPTFAQPIEE
jgi:hypothetical protein